MMRLNVPLLAGSLAFLLLAGPPATADVLGGAQGPMNLYAVQRVPIQIGDLVTVQVQESITTSSVFNATDHTQETTTNSLSPLHGMLSILNPSNGKSDSNNTSDQEEKRTAGLTTIMSVHVVALCPGGVVALEGSREMTVNRKKVTLFLAGETRLVDISADNTVLSTRLSDLRLRVQGLPKKKSTDFIQRLMNLIL